MMNRIFSIIFIVLCISTTPVYGSDTAKEKRWADQIVDGLVVGDATWLQANGHKFLGIFTEHDTDKPRGAAIIVHGIGVHPDWPDVVQPLRSELPTYGWATLSLQMPILANDAKSEDYEPLMKEVPARITAGIAYLREQGYHNIVIISHSLGSKMSAYHLARNNKGVAAFVSIGMQATEESGLPDLRKIRLPMLDMYGSQDLGAVIGSAADRKRAARKAGNEHYRQVEVPGANHFFQGVEADLVRHVKSWLAKFSGTQVKKDMVDK